MAALSMLGKDAVYDRLRYFYTDQYDLGMEYTVTRNQRATTASSYAWPSERRFTAFRTAGKRVPAGMSVDVWDVMDPIRSLITSGSDVDDMPLSDPDVPLDRILP
ncbi:oxidoreductase C-terminal domain-containing protein [Streptomyces sp. NPDC051664]|uniref:oxidoreductase C-terminal domain-containing protein n=1 Tax=Streptomyces sp. NPDC051664 TaxID=3365668 RepID=UPI0037B299BC